MIIILSPAKRLDYDTPAPTDKISQVLFNQESEYIGKLSYDLGRDKLKKLMNLSDNLADITQKRFENFISNSPQQKQALFVFNGDVYEKMNRSNYNELDIEFAQKKLRIISGVYGVLRPLDQIKPYRLEMSVKLENKDGKDLYAFWKDKVTHKLSKEVLQEKDNILLNLASNEYSSVIDKKNFKGRIIEVIFKEYRDGKLRNIPINSKRARGMMADFIIKNHIEDINELENFDISGYKYSNDNSSFNEMVFIKGK